MSKSKYWLFLLLAIPAFFVFRAFFLPGPLAWGDAPYYNQESLNDLLNFPPSWFNQTVSGLGGVNKLYWIYPLSLLYGTLNKFLGLPNDVLIRLIFYFPALLGSLIFPTLLARYLGYSKITQFFASLVYTFNTSFLLLIDGGQIGVALAYGIFPFSLLYLRKLKDQPTFIQFYKTLIIFLLLMTADARIAIMSFVAFSVWWTAEIMSRESSISKNQAKVLLLLCASIFGLALYWLYPAVKLLRNIDISGGKPLELISLLNSLFLFQPHWPANEFGRVFPVPFYFIGIPLLVFGSLLVKKKGVYVFAFCFLLFAFLTKGTTPPLGELYEFFVSHLPLGAAFRDSSKFFIPTMLFSGVLIGISVDKLFCLVNRSNKIFGKLLLCVAAVYLLALISPALMGKLNGVLAARSVSGDFITLNDRISGYSGSFRTVWFPENHPWAYSTFAKPAVDARTLIETRPLANLNTGTQDRFNFLHDTQFVEWFKLFGVKYLVFSGDPRKASLNEEERYDWNNLLNLVGSIESLKKINIGQNLPVYEIPDIKPRVFGTDKLMVVVGGDDIYEKLLEKDPHFSPADQPFLFVEDGKWDPALLTNFSPESVVLVMNKSDKDDLTFSFLQKYFVSPDSNSKWAVRQTADFLKYKYELLVNNVNFTGFDYGKGVAFSTKKGEKLNFSLSVPKDGEYVVAQRRLDLNGKFKWTVNLPQVFIKGTTKVTVENNIGRQVINLTAIIPKEEWERAQSLTEEVVKRFEVINVGENNLSGLDRKAGNWKPINYRPLSATKYLIDVPEKVHWIIFTDSFNHMWELVGANQHQISYPFYSTVNGFSASPGNAQLVFRGQEIVYKGLWMSATAVVVLVLAFWVLLFKKK